MHITSLAVQTVMGPQTPRPYLLARGKSNSSEEILSYRIATNHSDYWAAHERATSSHTEQCQDLGAHP
jgi:hypothetical protein